MTDTTKLRELLGRATPGPWHVWDGSSDLPEWYEGTTIGSVPEGTRIGDMTPFRRDDINRANAALIVEAVNALPALLDEVERLREDLKTAIDHDVVATCESCMAPLFEGDDFVSSDDCSGCWAGMTDLSSKRERPCYAYRVGEPDAREALGDKS